MPKKLKDDTPVGGWLGPRSLDENGRRGPTGPGTHYAAGVTKGGKWVWKPIGPDYEKVLAKLAEPKKQRKVRA